MTFESVMLLLSIALQVAVLFMSLIAFTYVSDKRAWKWFVLACTLTFVRRLTAMAEEAFGVSTNTLELFETVGISVLWLTFIGARIWGAK